MFRVGSGPTKRRTKEVCESCGCTPHAPRRRCSVCQDLVCVSNCWHKKLSLCNGCAAKAATVIAEALPTHRRLSAGGISQPRLGMGGTSSKGKTSRMGKDAFRCYATCTSCRHRQWQSPGYEFDLCDFCKRPTAWTDLSEFR